MTPPFAPRTRTRRLLVASLTAAIVSVLAAAYSPAPAKAEITIFSQSSPGEPVATLTRFTCRFTRRNPQRKSRIVIKSAPSGGYKLSIGADARVGQAQDIFYGGDNTPSGGPLVFMDGPGGRTSNVNPGPPGLTVAGAFMLGRGRFSIGTIGLFGSGEPVAFAGGGTCPKPKPTRRR